MKSNPVDIRPYTRQFYRNNRFRLVLMTVAAILSTLFSLFVSWLLQQVLDLVAGENVPFSLSELTCFAVIFGGAGMGIYLLEMLCRPQIIARGMAQYKEFVYEKLSKKSISAISGESSALYISALSNDAAEIEKKYLENLPPILEMCLCFVGALTVMFLYSPVLTGVSLGLSVLPILASMLTGGQIAKAEKQISDYNESYISTLRDSLSGFSVIKSFKAEARMCKIFAQQVRQVAKAKRRSVRLSVLMEMLGNLANLVVQFGVFLIAAYLALNGKGVTPGMALIFVQLLNYVLQPIAVGPELLAQRKAARGLIEKLATALEKNVRQEGSVRKAALTDGICVENLSFSYEAGKPVLKNLNFRFEAGKSYAIVGASGSGKSTFLKLLMAANPEYTGRICYDHTELRDISSTALYDIVCTVQQNVFIFNASIRDNITMFSEFPKEEVDRAIALSGLSELIEERGADYLCGENGNGLSGGEKQRICIARSLLKKSRVLLADEVTASMDAQTAWQISSAILELRDMTRIVVTHALDAGLLRRYDCILTMKNGVLTEFGDFDALMMAKGYFYSLYTVSQ